MGCDFGYHDRLNLLADLMLENGDRPVRKLMREALKYYPLHSIEGQRHWLRMRTAFLAADVINTRLGVTLAPVNLGE